MRSLSKVLVVMPHQQMVYWNVPTISLGTWYASNSSHVVTMMTYDVSVGNYLSGSFPALSTYDFVKALFLLDLSRRTSSTPYPFQEWKVYIINYKQEKALEQCTNPDYCACIRVIYSSLLPPRSDLFFMVYSNYTKVIN